MRDLGITGQMALIRLGVAYAVEQGADLTRDLGTRGGSNYDSAGLDNEDITPDPAEGAEGDV